MKKSPVAKLALVAFLCLALLCLGPVAGSAAEKSANRAAKRSPTVSARALSAMADVKTEAVLKPSLLANSVALMPGLGHSTELWARFFRHAVIIGGNLESRQPVALYYHFLHDICVLVVFRNVNERRFDVVRMQAMPGSALSAGSCAPGAPLPCWLTRSDMPFQEIIRQQADGIVKRFSAVFPAGSRQEVADLRSLILEPETAQEQALARLQAQVGLVDSLPQAVRGACEDVSRHIADGKAKQLMQAGLDRPMAETLSVLKGGRRLEIAGAYPLGGTFLVFLGNPSAPDLYLGLILAERNGRVRAEKAFIMRL